MYQIVIEQILCAIDFCVYVSLFKNVNENQKTFYNIRYRFG